MREAQDRQMSRLAFLAAAAVLAACSLALACPAHAVAYDYWYKVYDADMNLLYWSEDADAAVTSIDVNKLQEGIWFEYYYNGRVNPLPSVMCISSSFAATDTSTGTKVSSSTSGGISFAGSAGDGIDYERSDCLTTDEYGNTVFQFNEDGYFCGILYVMLFYEVGTISAGADVEFNMYLWPYGDSGYSRDESTHASFTLTATASTDNEEEGDEEADGESDAQKDVGKDDETDTDDGEIGEVAGGASGDGTGDAGDTGAISGSESYGVGDTAQTVSSAVSSVDDAGAAGEGSAMATSLLSDSAALSDDGSDERGAAAQQADTTAAGADAGSASGTASGASGEDGSNPATQAEGVEQTLSSLGTVLSVSGAQEQTADAADIIAVTGLPWLYILLAALLAAAAPCGALGYAAQRRRGALVASRLIGA